MLDSEGGRHLARRAVSLSGVATLSRPLLGFILGRPHSEISRRGPGAWAPLLFLQAVLEFLQHIDHLRHFPFCYCCNKKQSVSQKSKIQDQRSKGVKHTLKSRFSLRLCVQWHQWTKGEFPRETIEEEKNIPLSSTRVDWTRPILYLCRISCPRQRKPELVGCIEEVCHACWLHKHFKESFFKVIVRGREGFQQNTTRSADQRMPAN